MSTTSPSTGLTQPGQPDTSGDTSAVTYRLWKLCAWTGPVFLVGLGVSMFGIAGFLPPPGEDWGAERVARFFVDNEVAIRIGMEGVLFFSFFYFIWSLAIARVMRRGEGRDPILSTIQLVSGASTAWIAILSGVIWLTASFRASTRPASEILLLNDLGWLVFFILGMPTVFQLVSYGVLILTDKNANPLMPRWLAYLTFWCALTFFAIFLIPTFQTGPFAWNGLITFYIALFAFFLWAIAASWFTFSAINRIEAEERRAP